MYECHCIKLSLTYLLTYLNKRLATVTELEETVDLFQFREEVDELIHSTEIKRPIKRHNESTPCCYLSKDVVFYKKGEEKQA